MKKAVNDEERQESDEESLESESDNGFDQLSAEAIFSDKDCKCEYKICKDVQHIKLNTPAILGSIGEFCAAFYHVPTIKNRKWLCLSEGSCEVAEMVRKSDKLHSTWTPPKSVVALVTYEINGDDNDIIVRRYSNKYIPKATKHAEEFFSDDINQPQDKALGNLISEGNLTKITMYITFQPCHHSTTNTPSKSCCDVLLGLLNDPRLKGVKMCIKPTHIFKAGNKGPDLEKVENGKQGIRELMNGGIEITRMEEADWNFLWNLVAMNNDQRRSIPPYSGSEREALDKETAEFLDDVKVKLTFKCRSKKMEIGNILPSGSGATVDRSSGRSHSQEKGRRTKGKNGVKGKETTTITSSKNPTKITTNTKKKTLKKLQTTKGNSSARGCYDDSSDDNN